MIVFAVVTHDTTSHTKTPYTVAAPISLAQMDIHARIERRERVREFARFADLLRPITIEQARRELNEKQAAESWAKWREQTRTP